MHIKGIMMQLDKSLNYVEKIGFYNKVILKFLEKIESGHLSLQDGEVEFYFGNRDSSLHASIVIYDKSFYSRVFWGGGIAFAECYLDGVWGTNDLTNVIRVLAKNMHLVDSLDNKFMTTILQGVAKIAHLLDRNTYKGARRNIAKHYDMSNDFFAIFLDPTMMYSCAKFKNAKNLEEASIAKLDMICKKLELKSTDHILEIGTGWGGFAVYAVQNYGCKVTTTTISAEQYKYSTSLVKRMGLENKITLLLDDYRNLTGKYDKLVSIEMIEAVGHKYFDTYFAKCNELLKDTALCLIQAITIAEYRYKQAASSVDFIQKHIFPGGCLPSVSSIMRNITDNTNCKLLDLDDISIDYAKTLKSWRLKFRENIESVKNMGFDNMFIRKWLYYLCYCEAGFLEHNISCYQLLFSKPEYRAKEYFDYKTH